MATWALAYGLPAVAVAVCWPLNLQFIAAQVTEFGFRALPTVLHKFTEDVMATSVTRLVTAPHFNTVPAMLVVMASELPARGIRPWPYMAVTYLIGLCAGFPAALGALLLVPPKDVSAKDKAAGPFPTTFVAGICAIFATFSFQFAGRSLTDNVTGQLAFVGWFFGTLAASCYFVLRTSRVYIETPGTWNHRVTAYALTAGLGLAIYVSAVVDALRSVGSFSEYFRLATASLPLASIFWDQIICMTSVGAFIALDRQSRVPYRAAWAAAAFIAPPVGLPLYMIARASAPAAKAQ